MSKERFTLRAAVYLCLIEDNKVLLLRRFNTGWKDGSYTLIAGHLDGDERVTQTMSREALEEGGIIVKPEDLEVVHTMHRKSPDSEYVDFYLTPKAWTGNIEIKEPNKADDLSWFSLDNLPENLLDNVSIALRHINNNVTFSEVDWD